MIPYLTNSDTWQLSAERVKLDRQELSFEVCPRCDGHGALLRGVFFPRRVVCPRCEGCGAYWTVERIYRVEADGT